MIGDPARLGPEAEALAVLCARVLGPVWRLDPFHYAFRARPEDLGGALAGIAPEGWTAALEAALRAELGAEAVWISATDLPPAAAGLPDLPLLLLRAQGAALAEGLAAAGPGTQAVIQARFAVEAARLAAGAEPGSALARRLAVIETRQEEILEMLVERAAEAAAEAAALGRLAATLAATPQRLDAQAAALAARAADELGRTPPPADAAAAAFRTDLGLTLAEFLARLEQAAEGRGAPLPAPALPPARLRRRRMPPSEDAAPRRARRWRCAWPSRAACAPSAPSGSPASCRPGPPGGTRRRRSPARLPARPPATATPRRRWRSSCAR